ncbi:hypothetical protein [Pseudooceanicola sp. LIPI14-2-Ac024]|uniref:hypothetical protein n=1 Tax=Pseudooceanicola sp. LIPI14-2-Ac024 TaxID=3344875 RepID=UPI0035D0D0B3
MFRALLPLLLLALPAGATTPIAEVLCEQSDRMEQRLSQRMGSERQAMGLRGPEQVMELWTERNGDWTLVVTYASGTSCIVAMGQDWQATVREPA